MRTLIPNRAADIAWTSLKGPPFNHVPMEGTQDESLPGNSGSSLPLLTAGATQALSANKARACLILQNNSASGGPVLWFAFGQRAVVNQSFALQPGGSLVIANFEACPKESLWTLVSGAGTFFGSVYESTKPVPPSDPQAIGALQATAWGPPVPAGTILVPPANPAAAPSSYRGFVPTG